ncbi:DNA-directed RNA polymerase II subunit RPB1-like [Daphnia pulex]|uniref:DNA-directed RNA polymerase II subunit RPB1-like n=1 Tax=Daphnia pulex TaxID=6669 RepID=UPI001EDEBB74|nr:DNA-directed RNA polymerase II subunit RPB1-like [Daphnia pulex]
MKFLMLIALVAIAAADDHDYSPSYKTSYSAPSYSAPSYSYSAPSYSYSAPTYRKTVLVYPAPHYETVEYAGYTHGGKKGKKAVPVYKAVSKY